MRTRRLNLFEKILLFIGLLIIIVGFGLIQSKFITADEGITWDFLQTIFLWLVVVLLIIFIALIQHMHEELQDVIANQTKELFLVAHKAQKLGQHLKRKKSKKK